MTKKLKSVLCALFALLLIFPCGGILSARADTMKIICNVGGNMYRVKLRKSAGTDSAVIGQYFVSVEVNVISENNGWAHVTIGGREGYMMSKFLKTPDGWYCEGNPCAAVYPDADGLIGVYAEPKAGSKEICRVTNDTGYSLRVIGTIDDNWLHIMKIEANGDKVYGYASSTAITQSDNYATAITTADSVNVRAAPSKDSDKLGQLFAGVTVNRLFDNHVESDGWEKIRIGSVIGYIDKEYLGYYSAGYDAYVPPVTELKNSTAPLYSTAKETSTDSVLNRAIEFSVLGVFGSRYLVRINRWEPFTYDYGFIDTSATAKKVTKGVSTEGEVKRDTAVYMTNPFTEAPYTTLKKGDKLTICGAGAVTDENGYTSCTDYYIQEADEYVLVECRTSDGIYVCGWAKKDDLEFDKGLLLPEAMTNG